MKKRKEKVVMFITQTKPVILPLNAKNEMKKKNKKVKKVKKIITKLKMMMIQ